MHLRQNPNCKTSKQWRTHVIKDHKIHHKQEPVAELKALKHGNHAHSNAGFLRSLQCRFTYLCRQTFLFKAENLRNAKKKFAAQWKVGHPFSLIMQYLFLAVNASCILIGNYLRTLCCVLLSFHFFFSSSLEKYRNRCTGLRMSKTNTTPNGHVATGNITPSSKAKYEWLHQLRALYNAASASRNTSDLFLPKRSRPSIIHFITVTLS